MAFTSTSHCVCRKLGKVKGTLHYFFPSNIKYDSNEQLDTEQYRFEVGYQSIHFDEDPINLNLNLNLAEFTPHLHGDKLKTSLLPGKFQSGEERRVLTPVCLFV